MSKMMDLNIDVSKIDKSKLFVGKKGTYLKVTIALSDEKDEYGNDVSCWVEQTKEEREAKANRIFLGNGKVFWSSNGNPNEVAKNTNLTSKEMQDKEQDKEYDLPF